MGQILSQPETEKHSEADQDKHLAYGLSCMQGWRINMEDAHATILNLNEGEKSKDHVSFFGVYDGHGGEKSAIFTGIHLHELVRMTEAYGRGDYATALKNGFLSCDQAILQDFETRNDESGCAATSAIITPTQIICANAGDSRTVMSINGFAKALSYDHKPYHEGEKARITAGGGYVDAGRVNGNLALSRGIGDFMFKKNGDVPAEEQIVTCYPDIITHNTDLAKDEFVILACDGIWDCLSSQTCVECVRRGIYERKSFTTICEEIMELCCAPTSDGSGIGCDNMSILIVALLDHEKGETLEQWYERVIKKIDLNLEQTKTLPSKEDEPDAHIGVEYGPMSPEYNTVYKEIFGDYYDIGQQGSNNESRKGGNGYSMFGNMDFRGRGADEHDEDAGEDAGDRDAENAAEDAYHTGAVSLQKLLSSNVITNENGVIYLDTSSAQSLLASFGMPGGVEEVEDGEDDEESTLQRHIEDVDGEESDSTTQSA